MTDVTGYDGHLSIYVEKWKLLIHACWSVCTCVWRRRSPWRAGVTAACRTWRCWAWSPCVSQTTRAAASAWWSSTTTTKDYSFRYWLCVGLVVLNLTVAMHWIDIVLIISWVIFSNSFSCSHFLTFLFQMIVNSYSWFLGLGSFWYQAHLT